MNRIHFHMGKKIQITKIAVPSAQKHRSVSDLCFVAFSGLEPYLPLKIDVTHSKQSLIQIRIHGADRHIQLRMIG